MSQAATQHQARTEWLETPTGRVQVLQGGRGDPLVVLHRDTGPTGWGEFEARLAEHFSVSAPSLPGFGESERPDWMRTTQEMAVVTGHILDQLVGGPCALVGLGFGGWVAAELAALSPARLASLVLVSPMGLKPSEGEILDQFLGAAMVLLALLAAERRRWGYAVALGAVSGAAILSNSRLAALPLLLAAYLLWNRGQWPDRGGMGAA